MKAYQIKMEEKNNHWVLCRGKVKIGQISKDEISWYIISSVNMAIVVAVITCAASIQIDILAS
jgi:hypothetical protein